MRHDEQDRSAAIEIDTGTPQLLCSLRDRVLTVTLNRPAARNALSDELSPALRRIFAGVAAEERVGAVVVTGAGGAFCAGGDVKSMAAAAAAPGGTDQRARRIADLAAKQRALTGALHALRKPTIAALPGAAAGAGLALALACDLRIAAASAFVSTAYARVALSGDYGMSWLLTRVVGTARARELMYTAARVDAQRAEALGLVNWVVPDGELAARADSLARELANGPSEALRAMKENLDDALAVDFAASLDREAERLIGCMASADHAEAARAFAEKRAPVFRRSAGA
jgi:enoyl-CoA hydratase/carnithine racemase